MEKLEFKGVEYLKINIAQIPEDHQKEIENYQLCQMIV
jgi:hypothetical protein